MVELSKKEINLINKMIECYWNENNASHLDNEKDYDLTIELVKKLTIPVVVKQSKQLKIPKTTKKQRVQLNEGYNKK